MPPALPPFHENDTIPPPTSTSLGCSWPFRFVHVVAAAAIIVGVDVAFQRYDNGHALDCSPVLGTKCLKFEWFAPEAGLQFA